MNHYKVFIGIDVSKDSFTTTILEADKKTTFTTSSKPKEFEKKLFHAKKIEKAETLILMEHTGIYHLHLAEYLYKRGYNVVVINPYSMKNFFNAKGKRAKTDKVDSTVIAEYGRQFFDGRLYKPKTEVQRQIEVRLRILDDFQKQINMLSNQRESLSYVPMKKQKSVLAYYDKLIKALSKSIKKVEKEIEELCKRNYPNEWQLLSSIPGIKGRAISVILSMLRGFDGFDNAKKVGSYIGICPSPYESGKTVKGRGGIMKRGNSYVRKILYICALSGIRANVYCKALYERLLEKGKAKKLALVAVGYKLLRQAFGVLRNGKPFSVNLALGT